MVGIENNAGECRLYHPGHRAHYIQIRVVYGRTEPEPVTVQSVDGDVVALQVDDALRRYRNHDAALVRLAVDRCGPRATLRETLLCFPTDRCDYVFNLQSVENPWQECWPAPPSRQ